MDNSYLLYILAFYRKADFVNNLFKAQKLDDFLAQRLSLY